MSRIISLFSILSITIFSQVVASSNASGQEKPDASTEQGFGVFGTKSEYWDFMGNVKKIAYGPNGSKELQAMIPMLNDVALNKPIGSTAGTYKSQASTLGLLSSESIRTDIEMVDQQFEQWQKANRRIQQRVAKEIRELDFSKTETVTTRIRGIRDRASKELEDLLLPHQLKRLRQIHLQSRVRRQSLIDVLTEEPVQGMLEISGDQAADLRKEAEAIEADLQKEFQRLRNEAREKLLGKLKPAQRKQAKELLGNEFEFESSNQNNQQKKHNANGNK